MRGLDGMLCGPASLGLSEAKPERWSVVGYVRKLPGCGDSKIMTQCDTSCNRGMPTLLWEPAGSSPRASLEERPSFIHLDE